MQTVPKIPLIPVEFRKTVKNSENSRYFYLSNFIGMLEEYKKAVFSAYQAKKEAGALSTNLTGPTPKKLRDESLLVYKGRFLQKDEDLIKTYFNLGVKSNDYSSCINRFDVDKLRPLVNYLRGHTTFTEDRNINLLAWLIDFEKRPYDFRDYVNAPAETLPQPVTNDDVPPQPETIFQRSKERSSGKEGEITQKPVKPRFFLVKESERKSRITISIITLGVMMLGSIFFVSGSLNTVYICDGSSAKRYHKNKNCPTLKNCGGKVVAISLEEAKKNGKTLCSYDVD